jgi:sulfur-oxidizing protein SoxX
MRVHLKVTLMVLLSLVPFGAWAQSADPISVLSTDEAAGQTIAVDRLKGNCLACHTMRGSDVPSNVGPILDNMKKRFPNQAELVAILNNEAARNPQTIMPSFGLNRILTPKEISLVIAFLYTL